MTSKITIGFPELPALQRQALVNLYNHGQRTAIQIDAPMQTMRALERKGLIRRAYDRIVNRPTTPSAIIWEITDAGRRAISQATRSE